MLVHSDMSMSGCELIRCERLQRLEISRTAEAVIGLNELLGRRLSRANPF